MMRFYRLITPASQQTADWMAAIHEAAAAYDFAFLALGHADDEADMTVVRDSKSTRFVTHPGTRAVDGINLLLSGVTAMQDLLELWPQHSDGGAQLIRARHPLAPEVIHALLRALREASFPILLDRAGLGHADGKPSKSANFKPILVDRVSLRRVEAYSRHRAHTYFMGAIHLATLLGRYSSIEPQLATALDNLFGPLGLLGAATDDLQDLFLDFGAGIHSVCTVMAHLCVAARPDLRPHFRRDVPGDVVREQRQRLEAFFGLGDSACDHKTLLAYLEEIQLRRALTEHFEVYGGQFSAAIYKASFEFGLDPRLMSDMVSFVSRDPQFAVPDIFISAVATELDAPTLAYMNEQVGKFVTAYLIDRFWPK